MDAKHRSNLPQLSSGTPFLTEGGIETTLVFKHGIELPEFAAMTALDDPGKREVLRKCYIDYVKIAVQSEKGIVLESPTWRASKPWIERLGYPLSKITDVNRDAIKFLQDIRAEYESPTTPIVVSGNLGPLGDAYRLPGKTSLASARECYQRQVEGLAAAGADMLSMMTITDANEAIAGAQLAREHGMPIMVSFTIETDGRLLDGRSLADVINEVDEATNGYVAYFGVNCAHPTHIQPVLNNMEGSVRKRLGTIRANASTKSHQELDSSTELDRGDPMALGDGYAAMREMLPALRVVGGCCGTDEEHVRAVCEALFGHPG